MGVHYYNILPLASADAISVECILSTLISKTNSKIAMTTYDRDRLIALIKEHALQFGSFVLASGRTASFYLDCRQLTLHPQGANQVGAGMLQLLGSPLPDAIGGMAIGADPISAATITLARLTPFSVASEMRALLVTTPFSCLKLPTCSVQSLPNCRLASVVVKLSLDGNAAFVLVRSVAAKLSSAVPAV